jgi:hypothetical protein
MGDSMAKIEPASLSLNYQIDFTKIAGASPDGASWVSFVNLADGLSMQNKRLYRRNKVYSVDSVDHQLLIGSGETLTIQVVPLPTTYPVLQALARAERAWHEMNDQVTDAIDFDKSVSAEETKARWSDFAMDMINYQSVYEGEGTIALTQIGYDDAIGAPGQSGPALVTDTKQVDAAGKPMEFLTSGEKYVSKFQTPEGEAGTSSPNAYDEFFMTCIGQHIGGAGVRTSVSALESYFDTRIDPNVTNQETGLSNVHTDPLVNLFTNLDTFEEIADHLMGDGNRAPYPDNDEQFMIAVAGQAWLPPAVSSTSIAAASSPSGIRTTGGFLAPHGWVMLIIHPDSPESIEAGRIRTKFHLTPGTYRGTAAESVGRF